MRFFHVVIRGLFPALAVFIGFWGCDCDTGFYHYSDGVTDTGTDGGVDSNPDSDSDTDAGTGDFSIVVLPDTQYYTTNSSWMEHFYDQTQWIMDNRQSYNIKAVIHVGDIVESDGFNQQELIWADQAMSTLETPMSGWRMSLLTGPMQG